MRACLGFSILVAVLSVACGDSGSPTAPSAATLMGTWNATRAEYVSRSNQSVRVDVVARGTSMVLTLNSGTFTLKITDPGQQGNTLNGTWSSSKEVLKMSPSGMTWSWDFDMTFSGNTLTLNNGGALYDVNDDGRDEEAVLNMTLTRQ